MSWTAKIAGKSKQSDGKIYFSIEYSNSVTGEKIVDNHQSSTGKDSDWLKKEVERRVEQLETTKNYYDNSLIVDQTITPLSNAEKAKIAKFQEFSNKYVELKKEQELIDLGVLKLSESNVDSLRATVRKALLDYRKA